MTQDIWMDFESWESDAKIEEELKNYSGSKEPYWESRGGDV